MVLLTSMMLDAGLLLAGMAKRREKVMICRFAALSVIINELAFYVYSGLSAEFGDFVFLNAVCAAVAKVFVVWIFMRKEEPAERKAFKDKNLWAVYLLAVVISLCIHSNPMAGLVCELALLIFVLYFERCSRSELEPKTENSMGQMSGGSPGSSDLYLQTIEESYRKNRALMHDLNNHAIAMHALAVNGEHEELVQYIDTFSQKVKENMFPVRSGNIVLDALLADKYRRASEKKILVIFEKVRYSANLRNEDLCTVVGNLFDNAIEENMKCSMAVQRRISIWIFSDENSLSVKVKNPLFHELKTKNGLPVSQKPDAEHHGMGLKNVRRVCDKYGGTLIWDSSGGEFSVTADLGIL